MMLVLTCKPRVAQKPQAALAGHMPLAACRTAPLSIERSIWGMERGFLPDSDPLQRLRDPHYDPWEEALSLLPKYAVAAGQGELRAWLLSLPPFDDQALLESVADSRDDAELWRAYMLLSFLAHGYMWCDGPRVPSTLPAGIARPWCAVAAALDMPPILTYATYNLLNWRRLDAAKPVALGNIVCLANFLGGIDEEHFRLVHVTIEAQAAPAVAALLPGQRAASAGDAAGVRQALEAITAALVAMQATLSRMGEKCDPAIYYQRVRLPMSGWKNNDALPEGLVYESQFDNQPQQLYGETGAQSSILHALDAALGIQHDQCSWLKAYLGGMRVHMPPAHRAFIETLEAGPSLRAAVEAAPASLKGPYNDCLLELERFRSQHKAFAFSYIAKHSRRGEQETGTGGSDFMPALRGYRDATTAHLLP